MDEKKQLLISRLSSIMDHCTVFTRRKVDQQEPENLEDNLQIQVYKNKSGTIRCLITALFVFRNRQTTCCF